MRPTVLYVGALLAMALVAPLAGASHFFDDDSGFFSDNRRSSGDGFFSDNRRSSGDDFFDRDDDDGFSDRRSDSRSDRDLLIRLTDGRTVRVDGTAYELLKAEKGNDLRDEDLYPFVEGQACVLTVRGEVRSTDCDDVQRFERRALRETGDRGSRSSSGWGGWGWSDGFFQDDARSSFGLGLRGLWDW